MYASDNPTRILDHATFDRQRTGKMTRVRARAAPAQAARTRSKVPKTQLRKHKIIMESVTQEKKKLRSVISFEAKAPPGYTFIPAGNPEFTNACKEVCRKEGHKVFTVSTTPHQRMHDLSQQVHRIGYHFPSVVVAATCMEKGFFLSGTGKVMSYRQGASRRRMDSDLSQNAINAEARDAIKDLFPNIPKKDVTQIIKTAFQKGKKKVGTAAELPLARRAQLAVVAHIRHIYTDYDRLLRVTSFQEARAIVEDPTLAKLVEWRGDDENGKVVLEDVFREVIVISDDEEESESEGRDSSIEIVSSRTIVGELQTKPVNYGHIASADQVPVQDQSDDEAPPPGFRFVPGAPRRRKPHKQKIDRRGFSRYQAWDRAVDRFREAGPAPRVMSTHPSEPPYPGAHVVRRPIEQPNYFHTNSIREALPSTARANPAGTSHNPIKLVADDGQNVSRRDPPDLIRMSDGTVFERANGPRRPEHRIIPSDRVERRPLNLSPRIRPDIYSEQVRYQIPGNAGQHSQAHRVIPSIEDPIVTDPLSRKRVDHSPPSVKRHHVDEPHSQIAPPGQGPFVNFPGRTNSTFINDGRYQSPRKRNKVEHQNFPVESGRVFPAAAVLDHRNHPVVYPPGRHTRDVGEESSLSQFEEYPPEYRQGPTQPNLRLLRKPVADMAPVHGIPHNQFSGDFSDHEQPRQRPLSPRVFSRSDGSGYMPQYGNHPIRSRQLSHFAPSQQEPFFLDSGKAEAPRTQGYISERSHPALARSSSPDRRELVSGQRSIRSDIYAHDFVRPVQWLDSEANTISRPKVSPREVPLASVNRIYPSSGPSRSRADQIPVPSGCPPFQSLQTIPKLSTSRAPVPGPYEEPRSHFHPNLDSESLAPSQRRFNREIHDTRGDSLHGRYYAHDEPPRPTPRYPPPGRTVAEDRPVYYERIPARSEVFAAGH